MKDILRIDNYDMTYCTSSECKFRKKCRRNLSNYKDGAYLGGLSIIKECEHYDLLYPLSTKTSHTCDNTFNHGELK
jgi:hypothetical protein